MSNAYVQCSMLINSLTQIIWDNNFEIKLLQIDFITIKQQTLSRVTWSLKTFVIITYCNVDYSSFSSLVDN